MKWVTYESCIVILGKTDALFLGQEMGKPREQVAQNKVPWEKQRWQPMPGTENCLFRIVADRYHVFIWVGRQGRESERHQVRKTEPELSQFGKERSDGWLSHEPSQQVITLEHGPFCQLSLFIEGETAGLIKMTKYSSWKVIPGTSRKKAMGTEVCGRVLIEFPEEYTCVTIEHLHIYSSEHTNTQTSIVQWNHLPLVSLT